MKSLVLLVVVLTVLAGNGVQSQVIPPILTVTGTVKCTQNYTDATAPAFAHAEVQLISGGTIIATATTDINGLFNINLVVGVSLNGILVNVEILETCILKVTTPLVQCNASLTTNGVLVSSITRLNTGVFAPVCFIFVTL
ncbi:hypothetical protein LUZ63_007874 [Rhynchospora breviuscula]|uniref:Uncharacterized protein n=1 Tax=Rhynchospora breviuscula TaxID=2022672 RepID=A0A9Q0CSI1_9POAL|nr:hypothetical protein LUZ63_007874 [Rhynchospora breviuscula]